MFKALPLLLLLFPALGWGQSTDSCAYQIQGRVFDRDTREPMAFVSIQLQGTHRGMVSDEEGNFLFESICEKEVDLVFSYIGYKKLVHHHDFHHPTVEVYMASEGLLLESVVIEEERTRGGLVSSSAQLLTGESLEQVKTESFGEVASQIAGVDLIRTGQNVAKPVIHGLHSNRILVVNNGINHAFQNWGIEHAPEIDPSAIGQLEVIKGAATVRYGPEALGGVILTKPTPLELSTPFRGVLGLTGKSNGRSGEANAELTKGFKWLSVLAGGSYVRQGDLQAPDYNLSNTGKEELSVYGGFKIHPLPELDIEGYYSRFDQTLGILRGSTFGNLEDLQRAIESNTPLFTEPFTYEIDQPKQESTHDLYKAAAKYVGKRQAVSVQYGYQLNHRREFGLRRGDAPNIDLELRTHSLELEWQHPTIGNLNGRLGGQWQIQANDNLPGTNTVPFIPNFDSERYGFYLIEALESGPNTFELGIRYDVFTADIVGREPDNTIYSNTIDYRNWTATLGYRRQLSDDILFRTNFGTAWRPPNIAELYRFGQHAFFIEYGLWRYTIDDRFDFVTTSQGILDESDRAVPSEVGYKWINTLEINRPDFQLEATGYVNYIDNYIFSRPGGLTRTPRGFFVFFLYDQSDALFWGLDLTGRWTHSPQFSSEAKGSYLWAQQLSPADNFVGLPPLKISYDLTYRPDWKWSQDNRIQLSLSYTFEQFKHPRILTVDEFLNANQDDRPRFTESALDFDIVPPPPGFFLAHVSWRSSIGKLEWRLAVQNLFNTSYRAYTDRMRYFADDLGRNVVLSLTYRI